jgi:hypothetical protein
MARESDPMLPPPPITTQGEKFVAEEDEALGNDAVMRMIIPVGRSWLAIIAGYLGLMSVLIIPAPFALITGIMAVLEIKKNPKKHGLGRAIFGIVMGILGLVVGVPLLIFYLKHPDAFR